MRSQNLILGKIYSDFLLKDISNIKEVDSVAYFFKHKKLKTEVLYLKNKDKDRAFCIGFKTPTFDNTGVAHILEHSVLNGSKNYPTKDLFSLLSEKSISTYLNAATYPDKTIYLASSIYEKEFEKIFYAYIDAVFCPNILNDEYIFMQEGFRWELDLKNRLKCKGVVFNEMKGALSGPDRLFWTFMSKHLFSDVFYRHESGGQPKNIIDLTHEKLVNYYKKYYHPSNSLLFFYGDINILKYLDFLNSNYLKNFKREKIEFLNPIPKKWNKEKNKTEKFFVLKNEDIKEKSFLTASFLLSSQKNRLDLLAMSVLVKALMGEASRPLKKNLMEAGFCKEVDYELEFDVVCGVFSILCKNTNYKNKELFKKIITKTLNDILENGVDKEVLRSVLGGMEFYLESKNMYTKKGVNFASLTLQTWLYGFGHKRALEFREDINKLKTLIETDYFEKLIKKYLIENKNKLFLTMKASYDGDPERALNNKILSIEKSLNKKEIQNIKNKQEIFKKYQDKDSNADSIIKNPSKNNISKKQVVEKTVFKKSKDFDYIFHKIKSKNVSILNISFDLEGFSILELQYAKFLIGLLLELGVKNKDNFNFHNEIEYNFGSLSFDLKVLESKNEKIFKKIFFSASFLNKNFKNVIKIINDIFNNINLNEKTIKRVLDEMISSMEASVIYDGYKYAIYLAGEQVSKKIYIENNISGIAYLEFLKKIKERFDNNPQEILIDLDNIYKKIFTKNNLLVGFSSDKSNIREIKKINLKTRKCSFFNIKNINSKKESRAFVINSNVNYNAMAYKFKSGDFNLKMSVFMELLYYKYLHKEIREKNGAYGILSGIDRNGFLYICSYRDPRISGTFNDYKKAVKFLKNIKLKQEEIDKYIVKIASLLDFPKSDFEKSKEVLIDYICGFDKKYKQRQKATILNTSEKDFKKFCAFFQEAVEKGVMVSFGNSDIIKKEKDFFDKIELI